nr:nuclear pore complex protein NUP107 [Tanacetum cinerariifolium]
MFLDTTLCLTLTSALYSPVSDEVLSSLQLQLNVSIFGKDSSSVEVALACLAIENDGFGSNKLVDGGVVSKVISVKDAWYSGSDGSWGNPVTYILRGLCRIPKLILQCMQESVSLVASGNAHESPDELIELEILLLEREYYIWKMEPLGESAAPQDFATTIVEVEEAPNATQAWIAKDNVKTDYSKEEGIANDEMATFEVCTGNLVDVFKDAQQLIKNERVNIMRDLILAIKELNGKHIMHGNLNPRNVLIQSSSRGYRVKLCGLGNSKQIYQGSSLGDIWMSMHNSEMSNLGETLLYIMSEGEYKFQVDGAEDEGFCSWTVAGKKDIIKDLLGKLPLDFSLPITLLTDKDDDSVIPPDLLLVMPCFWNAKKKMYMLRDVSDQLLDIDSDALESRNLKIFGGNWKNQIDEKWYESMKVSKDGRTHHYNTTKMKDLLILCRNNINLPGDIFPGTDPITLEGYLSTTWPSMFMHVYNYALKNCPKKSAMYNEYFAY